MDEATLGMYASRVWGGTKWCYPNLERLLKEKATLETQLAARDAELRSLESRYHDTNAALDNAEELLADKQNQLAAANEAVRVLGEEVEAWRNKDKAMWNEENGNVPTGLSEAAYSVGRAINATDSNPLARASVEKAGKQ